MGYCNRWENLAVIFYETKVFCKNLGQCYSLYQENKLLFRRLFILTCNGLIIFKLLCQKIFQFQKIFSIVSVSRYRKTKHTDSEFLKWCPKNKNCCSGLFNRFKTDSTKLPLFCLETTGAYYCQSPYFSVTLPHSFPNNL